jgi:hypothetical protein
MMRINRNGMGLLETITAIAILSFVMVSIFTIVINIRTQTFAANQKIHAIEIGTSIRDQIQNELDYQTLSSYLTEDVIITEDNPFAIDNFPIEVLSYTLDGVDYGSNITLTFHEMTADHIRFGVIDFTITINYYSNREIDMEGVIYE